VTTFSDWPVSSLFDKDRRLSSFVNAFELIHAVNTAVSTFEVIRAVVD
jgi:hypothetical protein